MPKASYQPPVRKTYNSLFNLIEPEKIEIEKWYTCTINLADCYEGIDQTVQAYKYFLYKYIKPYMWFKFNPEVSKKGRFHLHGRIMFNYYYDILKFYLRIPEMMKECAMEIDEITDSKVWEEYCEKQYHHMTAYLHDHDPKLEYELTHENIKKVSSVHLRDIFIESFEDYEINQEKERKP